MIHYYNGNILDCNANVICQQVNCKGVMGIGLAKQIREKYPKVYLEYKARCTLCVGDLLGINLYTWADKNKCIASLFSQDGYGTDKQYTNYEVLKSSLEQILIDMYGWTIAIPYGIGCGLAGGDWNIVKNIIDDVFSNYPYNVQIWRL